MAINWSEKVAKDFLETKGYKTLASNYTIRGAEVDLVMRQGIDFVFVEVRQRKSAVYGAPAATIDVKKISRIRYVALHYMVKHYQRDDLPMRFDALLILGTKEEHTIEHIMNAF